MDRNFRKRVQQTLYSGELEPEHNPLALTELAVEFYQDLTVDESDPVDLNTASTVSSQETVSPASMVMSMVYARRLKQKQPDRLKKLSSSDVFLISMMMASKYLYDEGVDEEVFNDEWAENMGMDKQDINTMELDFLDALEWELFIGKEDFEQAMLAVERNIALREGLKRGWFSYTDLCLLLDNTWKDLSLSAAALEWLKVTVISAAVYSMGVMVLLGSTALVVNTSLALASSGPIVSSLLLKLHTSLDTSQPLLPVPSLPVFESPRWLYQPYHFALQTNDTEAMLTEENRPVEEIQTSPHVEETSFTSAVLSQLMAVLTLKSQLVQFVHGVSDGYSTITHHSHCKTGTFRSDVNSSGQSENDVETEGMDMVDVMSKWRDAGFSGLSESDFNRRVHERGWPLESNNMETDYVALSGRNVHNEQYDAWGLPQSVYDEWRTGHDVKQWQALYQNPNIEKSPISNLCTTQHVTSLHSLFPDVFVGFSTSMPPTIYVA